MNRTAIYNFVYEELSDMPIFNGKYDAKHGDEHFMNGIGTVMEYIAFQADREENFDKIFFDNRVESLDKAGML